MDLLERMDRLGIHTANLGLPGAGGRPREDILKLAAHRDESCASAPTSPAAPSSATSSRSSR
jgi:hypothetical protein